MIFSLFKIRLSAETAQETTLSGADDYITKSFESREILKSQPNLIKDFIHDVY